MSPNGRVYASGQKSKQVEKFQEIVWSSSKQCGGKSPSSKVPVKPTSHVIGDDGASYNKQYIASTEEIRHIDEVLNLMYVMTGNRKFEQVQNEVQRKEEIRTMKDWLDIECDKWEQKGQAKALIEIIDSLVEKGYSLENACAFLSKTTADYDAAKKLL